MLKKTAGSIMASGLLASMAVPISAVAAPSGAGTPPNVVGACIRGFATDPGQFNVDEFGTAVSANASTTRGAGVIGDLEFLRSQGC